MRLFSKENQECSMMIQGQRSYFESGGGLNSDSKWGGGGGAAENTFFPVTL